MYLAYVDESGDRGEKGSHTFALGCVLVPANAWPTVFDELIGFRRFLRDRFGVPVRAELKANVLIRNSGPLAELALPEGMRRVIYRQAMRLHPKIGLRTFAVVIDKEALREREPEMDPREVCWEFLLQRLERASEKKPLGPTEIMVVHDEGEGGIAVRLARRARRAGTAGSKFGTGSLSVPFRRLVDDPTPRNSRSSYFLQLADLAAYAAFRRIYPPSVRVDSIVPQGTWDELGDARYRQVSTYEAPGIVYWPIPKKGGPP